MSRRDHPEIYQQMSYVDYSGLDPHGPLCGPQDDESNTTSSTNDVTFTAMTNGLSNIPSSSRFFSLSFDKEDQKCLNADLNSKDEVYDMDIKVENSPVDQFFKDVISSKKVYVLADGEHLVLVPSNEYAYDSSDIEDIDPEESENLDTDDLEEVSDEADEGEIPFRVLPVWSQSYTKQAHLFAEDFEVKEMDLEDLLALLSDFEEEQDLLIGPNWDEDTDCEELFPDEVMSKLGVFPAENSE